MRIETTREHPGRRNARYASDPTAAVGALIAPHLPAPRRRAGRHFRDEKLKQSILLFFRQMTTL